MPTTPDDALPIEVWIDPGDASAADVQEVFGALSDLHRAHGGLGLEIAAALAVADRIEFEISGWRPVVMANEDVLSVLKELRAGTITAQLDPDQDLRAVSYNGNVAYVLSNGWRVRVFNDCGGWDYIDSVIAPDLTTWTYEELERFEHVWSPTGDEVERVWSWSRVLAAQRSRT
jgi:hypothetical protein